MQATLHSLETSCLVIGGGPAGYGAALAAQRGGCPTILAERHGYLGGMGTAAGLSCYLNHKHEKHDLSGAIYREFVQLQHERGMHYYDAQSQADFFEPESCKRTMELLLIEAGGTLLYHSLLAEVVREGDSWVATFVSKGACTRVRCKVLIDTSGDGDACALAGVKMTHGRRSDGLTQPMSMVVQLGGFDPRAWKAAGFRLVDGQYATEGESFAEQITAARAAGHWSIPRTDIALFWAMPGDPTRITINGTRINGLSACNPLDTTRAEIEGRRQAAELLDFFRRYVPGFSRAYLLQTGPQIGVRESRRIVGRAVLDEVSVREGVMPASTVTLCAYPIDVHSPVDSSTQFESAAAKSVYGIPWESLLPQGIDGLIAAGRCISATHEAAGSFRVMPTCMTLGEAAGTAAAMAEQLGVLPADLSGESIRAAMDERLVAMGWSGLNESFSFSAPLSLTR
jgi:hypothetical protein